MDIPETRYARSGDVSIAYQAFGEGPIDLVFAPGFVSNVEIGWLVPGRAEFLRSLSSFARVIQFDKRGTGMSDPVRDSPTLEVRMDDVRAVMDAAGSERAALLGVDSGGTMSAVFAATHPDRTAGLVLFGTSARTLWAPDHPWGPTEQEHLRTIDRYERFWGTPDLATDILGEYSPSLVPADDDTIRIWASYFRQSASPGTITAFERMNMLIDVRGVLPAIHVPTLVVHRSGDRVVDVRAGRFLADQIPGARFVEVAGEDHSPFGAGASELVETTGGFLADLEAGSRLRSATASSRRSCSPTSWARLRGQRSSATPDGTICWSSITGRSGRSWPGIAEPRSRRPATGSSPRSTGPRAPSAAPWQSSTQFAGSGSRSGRASTRASASRWEARSAGSPCIGSRVADAARAGEVLVSGTVKDLVAGSELEFEERETAELKGVPGEWRLYAVSG